MHLWRLETFKFWQNTHSLHTHSLHTHSLHTHSLHTHSLHTLSVQWNQCYALYIQFIMNWGPLHALSITWSSSGDDTQVVLGILSACHVSLLYPVVYQGRGVWGVQTPLKFQGFDKADLNSQFCGKYICNNLIRIRVSLICKLSGTPDYGATAPRSPILPTFYPQLNLLNTLPPLPKKNSWVCHWLNQH
jgi:hypothetical protein